MLRESSQRLLPSLGTLASGIVFVGLNVSPPIVIAALLVGCALWWAARGLHRQRVRRRLLSEPLSDQALKFIERSVPLYYRLPSHLQQQLQGCINRFLFDMVFVGCDGFKIDEEVRLTIAGNACLLIVAREKKYFSGFESILVYPAAVVSRQVQRDGLVETHYDSARAGESWHRGPVVLSWSDIEKGLRHERDGHNVVLHEFAHKLDEENTVMDGLPVLREPEHYREWAEVLTREYSEFLERVDSNSNDVIDEYGAVSAVEFFAVATESFFEKSSKMKRTLPELYGQFQQFYGLDPAQW